MTKELPEFTQPMGAEPALGFANDKSDLSDPIRHVSAESVPSLPAEIEDDDEALEQYMTSMLERLTGTKPSATAAIKPEPVETVQPVDAIVEETAPVVESPREPVRPSELREDLSGMRELANRNVASALGVHTYSRLVKSTKVTLAAALGMSFASTLLVLLSHHFGVSWAYSAAIAGTSVATLASLRYFGLSRKLAKIDRQLKLGTG